LSRAQRPGPSGRDVVVVVLADAVIGGLLVDVGSMLLLLTHHM
jgi:hypothetical protein